MAKRILVVDDDMMNLKRTKYVLGRAQYEVALAESGAEALDQLKREKFDLILLDIEMPGMNGMETFRRIQEMHRHVPVIFLTASGDQDDVVNAIKMGAVNYLKKPFAPKELLNRIEKVLV